MFFTNYFYTLSLSNDSFPNKENQAWILFSNGTSFMGNTRHTYFLTSLPYHVETLMTNSRTVEYVNQEPRYTDFESLHYSNYVNKTTKANFALDSRHPRYLKRPKVQLFGLSYSPKTQIFCKILVALDMLKDFSTLNRKTLLYKFMHYSIPLHMKHWSQSRTGEFHKVDYILHWRWL